MRIYSYLFASLILLAGIGSCTTEKIFFKESNWWLGHWQNISDANRFFSGGQRKILQDEEGIIRYYFSSTDTILHQYLAVELVEFNYRKRWKLMKTADNQFIKIKEIDRATLEVSGPVSRVEDLYDHTGIYAWLPEGSPNEPFDYRILYVP